MRHSLRTFRRARKLSFKPLFKLLPGVICVLLILAAVPIAQTQQQPEGNAALPGSEGSSGKRDDASQPSLDRPKDTSSGEDFRLSVETDLVVLHATVMDKDSRPVADLRQEHFKVFENNVEQKLKVFKREDIPVSVGIVVDNSGSMRDKRKGVNASALKFVRGSNPRDEVFIVNFNDEVFLDTDFTDNVQLLEEGLEKIDARGGTALYDAIDLAINHLTEKATLDKKVLLVVTDGEDNASQLSLEETVKSVERSDVVIHTVGLLGGEGSRSLRRTKRALEAVSKASGGSVFFPKDPNEVNEIAGRIAHEIRNQYVLAYTPTNLAHDGSFRKVEVKVSAPKYGKLSVRTRTGYYAERSATSPNPPSGS